MRRNAKAKRREEALRDAMVLHDPALHRNGVAQRRKDRQRGGIATLWEGKVLHRTTSKRNGNAGNGTETESNGEAAIGAV